MSSNPRNVVFDSKNLDQYLYKVAKEYKKLSEKGATAEIILVGGAAILASFSFREMTRDVDAIIRAGSAIKDAINRVGDSCDLPNGWLNDDFILSESYSDKLIEHSKFYKCFAHTINVRIVSDEYLLAMKLRAGRRYKNDLSDIVGILKSHIDKGAPLLLEDVEKTFIDLYEDLSLMSAKGKSVLHSVYQKDADLNDLYKRIRNTEVAVRDKVIIEANKKASALNKVSFKELVNIISEQIEKENK